MSAKIAGWEKTKIMEPMEKDQCNCPVCAKREEEQAIQEDLNFAILIALVPALAITLFSNIGLF